MMNSNDWNNADQIMKYSKPDQAEILARHIEGYRQHLWQEIHYRISRGDYREAERLEAQWMPGLYKALKDHIGHLHDLLDHKIDVDSGAILSGVQSSHGTTPVPTSPVYQDPEACFCEEDAVKPYTGGTDAMEGMPAHGVKTEPTDPDSGLDS